MGSKRDRAFTFWSADTETAFIMALRFHGGVRRALEEIGRNANSAYDRRARDGGFAARWQAALDEHAAKRAAERAAGEDEGAMPNRARFDGWTPLRQRAFLRALATTGKMEKACELAGISATAAQNMRKKYPGFDAACERALAKAVPTLEQIAIDRAVNGVSEAVWHGGKLVGQRQRFSDSLMREMLKREGGRIDGARKSKRELRLAAEKACKRVGGFFSENPATLEELADALDKRFAALDRRRPSERGTAAEPARDDA